MSLFTAAAEPSTYPCPHGCGLLVQLREVDAIGCLTCGWIVTGEDRYHFRRERLGMLVAFKIIGRPARLVLDEAGLPRTFEEISA